MPKCSLLSTCHSCVHSLANTVTSKLEGVSRLECEVPVLVLSHNPASDVDEAQAAYHWDTSTGSISCARSSIFLASTRASGADIGVVVSHSSDTTTMHSSAPDLPFTA